MSSTKKSKCNLINASMRLLIQIKIKVTNHGQQPKEHLESIKIYIYTFHTSRKYIFT